MLSGKQATPLGCSMHCLGPYRFIYALAWCLQFSIRDIIRKCCVETAIVVIAKGSLEDVMHYMVRFQIYLFWEPLWELLKYRFLCPASEQMITISGNSPWEEYFFSKKLSYFEIILYSYTSFEDNIEFACSSPSPSPNNSILFNSKI